MKEHVFSASEAAAFYCFRRDAVKITADAKLVGAMTKAPMGWPVCLPRPAMCESRNQDCVALNIEENE